LGGTTRAVLDHAAELRGRRRELLPADRGRGAGRAKLAGDHYLGTARCFGRDGEPLADLDLRRAQLIRLPQPPQRYTEALGDGIEVVSLNHMVGGGGGVVLPPRMMAGTRVARLDRIQANAEE